MYRSGAFPSLAIPSARHGVPTWAQTCIAICRGSSIRAIAWLVREKRGAWPMLKGELAAYKQRAPPNPSGARGSADDVGPTTSPGASGESSPAPCAVAQSLPCGSHFHDMASRLPAKPRVRPSAPPSTLSNLPILELPEPSPHARCLPITPAPPPPSPPWGAQSPRLPASSHAPSTWRSLSGAHVLDALSESSETAGVPDDGESGGTSLLVPRTRQPEEKFVYGASAPASMLWGPNARRPAGSSMGGRTPSRTLLDAMSQAEI